MSFRIRHLDHVVLRVRDMDAAIAFYTGVLGCREERRLEEIGLVQLRAGASLIDLVPGEPDASGANMDHFAVRIAPFDEASLRAWLAEHGVETEAALPRYGAEGTGPSDLYPRPGRQHRGAEGPAHGPRRRIGAAVPAGRATRRASVRGRRRRRSGPRWCRSRRSGLSRRYSGGLRGARGPPHSGR